MWGDGSVSSINDYIRSLANTFALLMILLQALLLTVLILKYKSK